MAKKKEEPLKIKGDLNEVLRVALKPAAAKKNSKKVGKTQRTK